MYGIFTYTFRMSQSPARSARIEARISPAALETVKRAAELQGRSVSDFVVAAAQEAAQRTIEAEQVIRLSIEDQRRFAETIISPAKPVPALKRAFARHRKMLESDG